MKRENRCIIFPHSQCADLFCEPVPDTPLEKDEILGRTVVSLVSTGSERGGYMDYNHNMAYPQRTGYAAVLEVLETGSDVTDLVPGDLVFAETFQQLYSRAKSSDLLKVPAGLAPETAVFCRFPAVSMSSLVKINTRPTEPVLLAGLGLVGVCCAQLLQLFGYDVYCFDHSPERCRTAQECGIRHTAADPQVWQELQGKFGAAIDCTGAEQAIYTCADFVRHGGELFLVGVPWRKTTQMDGHGLLLKIFYGYLHVISGFEWSLPAHSDTFLPNSHMHSKEKAMQWLAEGKLKVNCLAQVENPTDCAAVYAAIGREELTKTCVMFDWRPLWN